MPEETGWKRYLLASGVPLEHEVAQALVREGFHVNSEFEYLRNAGTEEKEFSVDLSGRFYHESRGSIKYTMDLLVECKYRSREKYILFFEDPNTESYQPTLGHTVAAVDEFVPFHLYSQAIYEFESQFPFVYKGIEVHSKGAVEQDLRHAVNQLKYAAPSFAKDMILSSLFEHDEDRWAMFHSRILVTNAPIRVAKGGLRLGEIEEAKSVDDISFAAEAVILFSNLNPDFKSHYQRVFSDVDREGVYEKARRVKFILGNEGKKTGRYSDSPSDFVKDLIEMSFVHRRFTTQIFVVTLGSLPSLLAEIKSVCREAYRKRRKSRKW